MSNAVPLEVHDHLAGFLFRKLRDPGVDDPVDPLAHGQHTGPVGGDDAGHIGPPVQDVFEHLTFCSYI